jgi:hypothetical protein
MKKQTRETPRGEWPHRLAQEAAAPERRPEDCRSRGGGGRAYERDVPPKREELEPGRRPGGKAEHRRDHREKSRDDADVKPRDRKDVDRSARPERPLHHGIDAGAIAEENPPRERGDGR